MKLAPKIYRKYVIMISKEKPLLYVQIQKALYGLLQSVIMFYRKLVKDLEAYGLQIRPYGPCMVNRMINNKQMILVWNVENLNVSHVNSFEITKVEGYLSRIYGGLPVHRRKLQDYLAMDLEHVKQGN